ncbi:hypothetical protein ACP4OV_002936 [Aristida adscensionis]
MAKLGVALNILVLCAIFLAEESQGYRFQLANRESHRKDASYPQDMDMKLLSPDTWSSLQKLYEKASPSENRDDYKKFFAVHLTKDGDSDGYYGLSATMDVYGYNLQGGQLTTAAVWISNLEGNWQQDLDSISVGWIVSPSHFNDSNTHLFTQWTRDADRTTGCANTDCPGFQLASGASIFPGNILSPVSDVNGLHQNISIKLFKDKSTGDWWLHCGYDSTPTAVGYFPASLFDSLSKKATRITFGGHVFYDAKLRPSPPMGSGVLPSEHHSGIFN